MRPFSQSHVLEVIALPDSMSFEDAVTVLSPAMCSRYCLTDISRLQQGDKVLIHSAVGATG